MFVCFLIVVTIVWKQIPCGIKSIEYGTCDYFLSLWWQFPDATFTKAVWTFYNEFILCTFWLAMWFRWVSIKLTHVYEYSCRITSIICPSIWKWDTWIWRASFEEKKIPRHETKTHEKIYSAQIVKMFILHFKDRHENKSYLVRYNKWRKMIFMGSNEYFETWNA